MITIDGSEGEGGGQVLRTALSLSMVTRKPFRIENIRAGRQKPGLLRQHLTAVNASAEISSAEVDGNQIGSTALTFEPKEVAAGVYRFAVGSAGSANLVLQTLLPALLHAKDKSIVTVKGGTHNMAAPPFEFLEHTFLLHLKSMGIDVELKLDRYGFYPAGGGGLTAQIQPCDRIRALELKDRGTLQKIEATAYFANLRADIAKRELGIVGDMLNVEDRDLHVMGVQEADGPGNVLQVRAAYSNTVEIYSGFGQKGVTAESVAKRTVNDAKRWINSSAAVGPYLADQLLLPMALAATRTGESRFTTIKPSQHTRTNADVIGRFLPVKIRFLEVTPGIFEIAVKRV